MRYILLFTLAKARLLKCDLSLPTTDLRPTPRLRGSTATFVEQGGKLHEQNYCLTEKKKSLLRPQSPMLIIIYLGLIPSKDLILNMCVPPSGHPKSASRSTHQIFGGLFICLFPWRVQLRVCLLMLSFGFLKVCSYRHLCSVPGKAWLKLQPGQHVASNHHVHYLSRK